MEITKSQIMQIDSILQITCLPSEEHSMDVLARRQPLGAGSYLLQPGQAPGRKQSKRWGSCDGTGLKHERLLNCAHLSYGYAPVSAKARSASKRLISRIGSSFPSQQDSRQALNQSRQQQGFTTMERHWLWAAWS